MAAVLLCAGEKGHRYALPNSRIMIHQPHHVVSGQTTDIIIKAKKAGMRFCEVGVNHYPRQAGEQSGANLGVILKAFVEIGRQWRHLR